MIFLPERFNFESCAVELIRRLKRVAVRERKKGLKRLLGGGKWGCVGFIMREEEKKRRKD